MGVTGNLQLRYPNADDAPNVSALANLALDAHKAIDVIKCLRFKPASPAVGGHHDGWGRADPSFWQTSDWSDWAASEAEVTVIASGVATLSDPITHVNEFASISLQVSPTDFVMGWYWAAADFHRSGPFQLAFRGKWRRSAGTTLNFTVDYYVYGNTLITFTDVAITVLAIGTRF